MSTLRELITSSYRLLGNVQAGAAPAPDDMEIGVEALNSLIDGWSTQRLTIHTITPYDFVLVPGKGSYTLGPGGDWNVVRPMTIEEASVSPDVSGNWV